jgi:hypothetical protein
VDNGRLWAAVSLPGSMVILVHCVKDYFVRRTKNIRADPMLPKN